ncbi:galactoside alpha-(1,2)-fucosyltransferase 2-like [Haliotis rubra]|uniref:galactoside alpha-(1,2)-fucosyltransferase 2-like n=1 Tax=Haliotis rubra TaxID=36100 RepID=UPI001EE5EC48|nr:galactoside alpha-(1,2)-fucosyltransferase 2-like [Haliotis rubra]
MRICQHQRKVALSLGLVAFGILVLLRSHVAPLYDDVMIRYDVTKERERGVDVIHRRDNGTKHRDTQKRRSQSIASETKSPLEQISKPTVTNHESIDPDHSLPKQCLIISISHPNQTKNDSETCKKTRTMTILGGGRLGNAMFQYASLVGVSSFHGYTATLASSHFLRKIFKLSAPASNYSTAPTDAVRETHPGTFDPGVLVLSHNVSWVLVGYYQSWKYFTNIPETIRREFTFRDDVIKAMLKEVPVLANWTRIKVGVHIRRGDMATKYERNRGYNIADIGFLNRSMDYFRNKYKNPLFIVCSDSITWCKDNVKSDDTIFRKGKPEVDLAVLAHCDHNIVTSGSFGWWGAWLAGGEVVYFKHFPREKTWLDRQYNKGDYYLPQWLGME